MCMTMSVSFPGVSVLTLLSRSVQRTRRWSVIATKARRGDAPPLPIRRRKTHGRTDRRRVRCVCARESRVWLRLPRSWRLQHQRAAILRSMRLLRPIRITSPPMTRRM